MDAITTGYCSSKPCFDNRGGVSKYAGVSLFRTEFCFSRSRKVFDFRILRLESQKLRPLRPIASLTPDAEEGFETTENGVEETYKTVHVRFQLMKECQFGEQFLLVGDDPMFGSWDPSSALPMNWSDGNLWTLDLDVPIGRQIEFKFILKGSAGIIHWQPDPDRVLKTWETDNAITVCEDWEDAALQRITEGERLSDSSEEPTDKSEMQIVADNLSLPAEKVIRGTENGSASADIVNAPAEIPSEEARDELVVVETESPQTNKSLSIVAENINLPVEKLSVDTADNVQTEEIPNRKIAITEDVPGKNLEAKAINPARAHSGGDLVTFDEGPVLVPGLTPFSMALAKGPIQLESDLCNAADVATGFEATDPKVPELEEKQEVANSDQCRKEETATAQPNPEEQLNAKQEEVPRLDREGRAAEDAEDQLEGEQVDHAHMDDVVRNDIQWGRKTLQNFLSNLGFLL